ncbi:hypothetical protein Taro_041444 [Colocasia esculenta]|uniref:Uncharacterized protein n=1 Tax=Colocasia esculenta TaxID=4460 RepID=A0A843WFW0_COLES|nr:hypothetical protein [Colocasia esculenta]
MKTECITACMQTSEGRPGGVSRVLYSLRVKEDQLRLGVRVLKGDSTLGREILRYCSGTGRRTPKERRSEPG